MVKFVVGVKLYIYIYISTIEKQKKTVTTVSTVPTGTVDTVRNLKKEKCASLNFYCR